MHTSNLRAAVSFSSLATEPCNKTVGLAGGKVEHTSNSSHEFSRTLDKYGIDNNLNKLSAARGENPTVFAHRDMEGNYKLETGLYISDPKTGDKYGEFRFHGGGATKKYQVPECTKLVFDESSLKALRSAYHETAGVTKFLRDVLDLKPCKDLDLYNSHPEFFSYLPPTDANSNGYLIFPNAPYIDISTLPEDPAVMKNRRDGVSLGAYAIHPNQSLSLIEKMEIPIDTNTKENHTDNTRTLSEIAADTGVKYLASILDLDIHDLSSLEKLQEHSLNHLKDVYNVDQSADKIQLYFHFPPADSTATLHLHIRVNVADHPLNQARSFELSDVIQTLKEGGTMSDMVMSRNNGVLYTLVSQNDSIRVVPDKSTIINPNTLTFSSSL